MAGAGNDNISQPFYPASYPKVIAVSATDRDDRKANFSNFGSYVHCCAPGVGIYVPTLNREYCLFSGTSASCAFVSGMAGLLLSRESGLSPSQVMSRIEDYSDDLGIPGKDNDFGYGRLNGFRLLFGDVPSYLALYGWEITGGNNDGYPEKGETFILKPVIKNIGVSDTLRAVRCLLTTDDSLVTIVDDICGIGDLEPGEALQSADGFRVSFSSDMPSGYISHFGITIEDTMGNVFTDELTLKEGDFLSMLSFEGWDNVYKEDLDSWIQRGYQVIVPSKLLEYKKWKAIGYIARDPEKGSAAMMIYGNLLGGATVVDPSLWSEDDKKIFIEGCSIVSLIPTILAPEENSVYYRGDSIDVTVRYEIVYDCGDGPQRPKIITKNYTYLSTAQHEPDIHYLCVEGFTAGGERVVDTRPIWVIEFKIEEDNVTKYFNPYKPDSAKIKYKLEPPNYANPDSFPNPLSMQVEIRDKDSVLVYGPRDLTVDEQRHQLLWWDGTNNDEDTLDMEGNPYNVNITGKYKESVTITSSMLKATASSSEEGKYDGDAEINVNDLLTIFKRKNGPAISDDDEEKEGSEGIVNDIDDDGPPFSEDEADNENDVIDGDDDKLDMVKLKLNCGVTDGKIELVKEKIPKKDNPSEYEDTAVVRIFNEKGDVVNLPEIIDKNRFANGPIEYYIEGMKPGQLFFKLSITKSEDDIVEDKVKLKVYNLMAIEYNYMQDDDEDYSLNTGVLDASYKEGYVLPEVTNSGSIVPSIYPASTAQFMGDIMRRYSQAESTPWYLESGKDAEEGASWKTGDFYGYAYFPGPYWSFALVFVKKIKEFKNEEGKSILFPENGISMIAIHEMGHEFGHLTDKYKPATASNHTSGKSCVMDQLKTKPHSYGLKYIDNYKFCSKCIDSLKRVDHDYIEAYKTVLK